MYVIRRSCVGIDQGSDSRVAAQLVQAAAAGRPDTADRDTQPGADLGIGHGQVLKQQGDQPLTGGRQGRERFAQRYVAFGRQQLLLASRNWPATLALRVYFEAGRRLGSTLAGLARPGPPGRGVP